MSVRPLYAVPVLASLVCLVAVSVPVFGQVAPRNHFPNALQKSCRVSTEQAPQPSDESASSFASKTSQLQPETKQRIEPLPALQRSESQLFSSIPPQDEALQAIAEVRQRVGGVASHLSDLFPKDASDAVFQKELAKLQSEVIPDVLPVAMALPPGLPAANRHPIGPTAPDALIIRNIASNLDRIAEQLEQLSRYRDADQIRGQAQSLRESVR